MRRSTFSIPVLLDRGEARWASPAQAATTDDDGAMTSRPSSRRRSPRRRRRSTATPSRSSSTRCRRSTGAASDGTTTRQRQHAGVPAEGAARRRSTPACAAPFNNGTFLWGYNINGAGASLAGAHDRGAQGHRDDRDLHEQPDQHAPAEPADRRPDDSLGRSARHHRAQQLRQRAAAGGRLHAAVRRPDPDGRAPARQRGAVAVRRPPRRLVDARLRPARAARSSRNTYNYVNQQEATTLWFHDHALGIVRLNVYAGLAGFYFIRDNRDTGARQQPDHAAGRAAGGRADARRTGSSTPTASSTSPTRTTRRT